MRTLLLNSSGEFLGVLPWQTAIGDAVVGNVRVLREYDRVVRSQHLQMRVPAVVREVRYVRTRFEHIFRISHSPRNVFIRDGYACQYCGYRCTRSRFSQEELRRTPRLYLQLPEMDHIVPKSRGGTDTWENTVTACRRCNGKKSNRMLADAGLRLRAVPHRPEGFRQIFEMKIGQIDALWYDFLAIYLK